MVNKIFSFVTIMSLAVTGVSAATDLESAQKLATSGIIKSGNTATDFGLNNTITRKEMMKIVMNLSGKNVSDTCSGSFWDVNNDWGCKYIESALSNWFIAANTNFRPNDSISRAESMKLILKAKWIEKAYNTNDWQADYMNTALDNGIISTAYSNHTSAALRGWIFSVAAAEKSMMDDKMKDKMEDTMMKDELNGYQDYDDSLLGQNKTTVLFFHAAWCPSCVAADRSISSETDINNILILKIDFDSETDLRKKYWVTSQHTFVQVDSEWEMIKKWSGWNTLESIQDKIQ